MFDEKDPVFFKLKIEAFEKMLKVVFFFKGTIKLKKPFLIRGKLEGKIFSDSDVVVDSNAIVNSDIEASRVLVKGKVEGKIIGKELIFVTSTGSVDGDIATKKVVLEPGCIFTGKCSMV